MRSSYKRIGDYVRVIKDRNKDGSLSELLGININKHFMPSVANIIGTDLTKYKIVKPNQFACNRMHVGRDKKLPIALSDLSYDFIVSPAYDVFEIVDTDKLLPEYLMMWISRQEFDRNALFYTDTDIRGRLGWDSFCDIPLPVPSIEKQQEIVDEYNIVVDRIKLNEKLNQKLEETAQAIYKEWFVDFEFPMTKEYAESIGQPELIGKPYKSNGGELVYNEELDRDIPVGWEVSNLTYIATYLNGLAMQKYESEESEYLPVIKIKELNQGFTDNRSGKVKLTIPKKYIISDGNVIFAWSGTLMVDIWCGGLGGLNQHLFKVTSKKYHKWFYYLWTKHHLNQFKRIAEGKKTSMGHIRRRDLSSSFVLIPSALELHQMNIVMDKIIMSVISFKVETKKLLELKVILLSKIAKVGE